MEELLTEDETKAFEELGKTFQWNQRRALSHLLTMEEHLKELEEEDVPHGWCLKKHFLLAVDHHVEEAIGHAERLGLDPTPYRNFRNKLLELNVYPQPAFTMEELLELRTEWRKVIDDPTLVEDCPLCAADVSIKLSGSRKKANKHTPTLKPLGEDLLRLEADYANKVHESIAEHKGRDKAPFMIMTCNGDPTGKAVASVNEHGEPFVAYCAGGVNAHTSIHEEDHVWNHRQGNCDLKEGNCPEDSAEQVALDDLSISQGLNTHPLRGGLERKMVTLGKYEVIGIYGASIVAKGVEYGLMQLDPIVTPNATKVWEKASFWGHVILGLVPPLLLFFGKKRISGKMALPIYVASAHIASNLIVEYGQELMQPAAGLSYRRRQIQRQTPRIGGNSRPLVF